MYDLTEHVIGKTIGVFQTAQKVYGIIKAIMSKQDCMELYADSLAYLKGDTHKSRCYCHLKV